MERRLNEETAGGSQDSGFTCPDCGGHSFTTVQHNDAFKYGAGDSPVTLHARVPVHCCDSCDFEFLGREGRLVKHEAVCRHLGLLTPTEIRSIRESHGMSRTAFAEVTGFGEATLNRWENGAVIQNRANDHLLRLMQSPDILNRLKRFQVGSTNSSPPETVVPEPTTTVDGRRWKRLEVSLALLKHQRAFRLPA